MMGILRFTDSGCNCTTSSPPVTVLVDGVQYSFPLFGSINIPLTPGPHSWSLTADMGPTVVQIVAGVTTTVGINSNLGCVDGCDAAPNSVTSSKSGASAASNEVRVVTPSVRAPNPPSQRSRSSRR
jgi:hypothetical protein